MPEEFTKEQVLLKKLLARCNDNAAELARRLKMDATYVNRLFYPLGKKGRKGVGLEVMRKASAAFKLPAGFWEGADASRILRDPNSTKREKEVAASDLAQRKGAQPPAPAPKRK